MLPQCGQAVPFGHLMDSSKSLAVSSSEYRWANSIKLMSIVDSPAIYAVILALMIGFVKYIITFAKGDFSCLRASHVPVSVVRQAHHERTVQSSMFDR